MTPDEIRPPDVDEAPRTAEMPRAYCKRVCADKAEAIKLGPDEIVLCADTTVSLGRRILGKPEDAEEAASFLWSLSGRRHRVVTAVAVKTHERVWIRDVVSAVSMKRLSEIEIESYLATEDWRGKAGGYAIQGPAAAFIPWIQGSYTAVMGLPAYETAQMLKAAGYRCGGSL